MKLKVNKEKVAQKFEEIIDEVNYDEENEGSELNIMNYYLRKNACYHYIKLFLLCLKNIKIKKQKLKNCVNISNIKLEKKIIIWILNINNI